MGPGLPWLPDCGFGEAVVIDVPLRQGGKRTIRGMLSLREHSRL